MNWCGLTECASDIQPDVATLAVGQKNDIINVNNVNKRNEKQIDEPKSTTLTNHISMLPKIWRMWIDEALQ
jgi:hypothetical protein